jgi:hypothetical protein
MKHVRSMGRWEICTKFWLENLRGKSTQRPSHRWYDNIKVSVTGGSCRLLHSDQAAVSLCVSGPSCHFLARIFGLDTPLFLRSTQFYFALPLLLFCKSHKSSQFFEVAQLATCFVPWCWRTDFDSIVRTFFSLITVSVMVLKVVKGQREIGLEFLDWINLA